MSSSPTTTKPYPMEEEEEEEDDDDDEDEEEEDESMLTVKGSKELKRPKAKPGPKKGSGNQAKWSRGDWYEACHTYVNLPIKMEQKKISSV